MDLATLSLTLVAVAAGLGILWVYAKTSDQAAIRAVKRKLYASLLELRVFADDPGVSWRAQKSLFAANARYLLLSFRPVLWLALPLTALLLFLEPFFGHGPLPVGREALVTMGMADSWNPQSPAPRLDAPPGVQVDGPPVRILDAREISWRLRPNRAGSVELRFSVDGREVTYPLRAGAGLHYLRGRTGTSLPLVKWVEIRYPDASLTLFGFSVNWMIWFFAVSMATALLLRKRFGVVL